ncbi:MAG: MFS transporter [Chloroflexi bacterium]|nr:MFS transporter [Chloroflexota bacterium]
MNSVAGVLRLPTYRRFLAAAICSGMGVWIFQTAIYWAGLQSGSTASVGILVAAISLPSLILTIPAGVLTDRVGPFWLLFIGSLSPALACIGGLALVAPDGSIALDPATLVTFMVGVAYALWSVPALVYVTRSVPPNLLGAAISLMVLQYATGRIAGGALGGLVVSMGGAGLAFGVSAAIFVVGMVTVLTLPRLGGLDARGGNTVRGLVEAVSWLRGAPATLALVALGALSSLLAYAYIPLLGALSRDVIGAGSAGLGILTATSGIGMVASGILADPVGKRIGRGRGVVATMVLGALSMIGLGQSNVLVVSVALLAAVAFLGSARSAMASYLMQSLTPARMRGRVTSLADFVAQLMSIVGSLAVGGLAVSAGVTAVLVGSGVAVVLVVGLVVALWPRILRMDVDRESRPVVGGRPYVEGRGSGVPLPETS